MDQFNVSELKSRPNECKWPLFILLFFVFAGAIFGDSAAEALLLAHFNASFVPNMFLINALFLCLISTSLISLIDRIDRGTFFISLLIVHCLVLFMVRLAIQSHMQFLYPVLFSYAYVSKIILFLMFWTIANDLFDSRKASSQFPFIASGGTLGAIIISFAIPWLLKIIAAENLLVLWGVLIAVSGIIFIPMRKSFGKALKVSPDMNKQSRNKIANIGNDIRLVYREPLLLNMAVLYFLLFFILINQQYAFYSQLKIHLTNAKGLASFLGYFNGFSMFATFMLQIFAAGPILKKIGSTRSLLFLPSILCIVFVSLTCIGCANGRHLMGYGNIGALLFWGIVAGMGLRTAFFDSFFSPNFQVFFSSLPHNVRGRGKLVLEGIVKPLAMTAASLWLLIIVPQLSFLVNMALLSCLTIALVVQTFRLRKKYTESLTAVLSDIKSRHISSLFNIVDLAKEEKYLALLVRVLETEEYEIKKYIIDLLVEIRSRESIAILTSYMERCDDKTCSTIISSISGLRQKPLKDILVKYLYHSDRRVVANCIQVLGEYNDSVISGKIEAFLNNTDNRIRANAVIALWPTYNTEKRESLSSVLLNMISSSNSFECSSALYAIGVLRLREFLPRLRDFAINRTSGIIADDKLWRQCLFALSMMPCDDSLELILKFSNGVTGKKYLDLVAALVHLVNEGYPLEKTIKSLLHMTYYNRGIVLNALRQCNVTIGKEYDAGLHDVALAEITSIYGDWSCIHTLDSKFELSGIQLLSMAIAEESIGRKLQNVVSVSSILDKSGQVGLVANRLFHPNRYVRARAFEVLDNSGELKINRWLLRLLDTDDSAIHSKEAALAFKIRAKSLKEIIVDYINDSHEWIRQCAAYAAENLFLVSQDERWRNLPVVGAG